MTDDPVTLVLSPHCDDVPLSMGAALLAGHLRRPMKVIVVFSRSCYTKYDRCTAPVFATTHKRKQEERTAATHAGYEVEFLPFAEPFVRAGYKTLEDIFDLDRMPKEEEGWEEVNDKVSALLRSHRGPVVGPLGCGGHIDHRIVSGCMQDFLVSARTQVAAFYEDLPYASWSHDADILASHLPAGPYTPVSLCGSLRLKLKLLQAYPSQLGIDDFLHVRRHWEAVGGGERLWVRQETVGAVLTEAVRP